MKRITKILFFLIIVFSMSACQNTNQGNFNANFVHSVHFWFKNPDNKTDRAFFETSLKKFLNASKYAKTNYIGTPPKATRDVVDGSFTYHLLVTFESAEAQAKYQEEEVHLKFIEESSHLWEKVIVYDSNGAE